MTVRLKPNARDYFSRGASRSAGMERGRKRREDRRRSTYRRKRGPVVREVIANEHALKVRAATRSSSAKRGSAQS